MSDGLPDRCRDRLAVFYREVERVLVGQRTLIDRLLIGLLTAGHVLLEGVPGLAKTTAVSTLARVLQLKFQRIQFTPDLLPADVIGTQIFNPRSGEFHVRTGPIFANIVLADEINRPAKVQSALLEAMQEKQVTIGETTFPLPQPFLVLATQNPIEQEGTYPLPEAQLDRFLLKVLLTYPSKEEEFRILERMAALEPALAVEAVLTPADVFALRQQVDRLHVAAAVRNYLLDLIQATRQPNAYGLDLAAYIQHGISPRGSIALEKSAKAYAFLAGRDFVTPGDVKAIAADVMRHRLLISYEAEAEDLRSDTLIQKILDAVPVP